MSPDDPIRRQLGDGVNLTCGGPEDMGQTVWWVRRTAVAEPDRVAVAVVRDGGGDLLCLRASDLPRLIRLFVGLHAGPRMRLSRDLPRKPDEDTDDGLPEFDA